MQIAQLEEKNKVSRVRKTSAQSCINGWAEDPQNELSPVGNSLRYSSTLL